MLRRDFFFLREEPSSAECLAAFRSGGEGQRGSSMGDERFAGKEEEWKTAPTADGEVEETCTLNFWAGTNLGSPELKPKNFANHKEEKEPFSQTP